MFGKLRKRSALKSDKRISIMSEIVSHIRAIKLNAWEYAFRRRIEEARRAEMDVIRLRNHFKVFTQTLEQAGFKLIYLAVLAPFVLSGDNSLSPDQVFFVMGCFMLTRMVVTSMAPNAVYTASEIAIALERITVSLCFLVLLLLLLSSPRLLSA